MHDPFNAAADPLVGRKLDGRYEVLERLGQGGTGLVYRARQVQLRRSVAIKVLHEDLAASSEWRRRFEREAWALSLLAHPNIVPVADFGIDRGVPFLVMELLEGKSLRDLVSEGPLPLGRALDIARQTLRGVAFAHAKGIVHRDLKPANIFLQALPDQADHVRLLDFGMVKFLDGSSGRSSVDLTRAGVRIGTAAYMSPEQVKGTPADATADVYSAGVLLFELLTGRRPFNAESFEGYMAAHLTQAVPSLAKLRPGLPRASSFQALVERAMAKKSGDRFPHAQAMLAALEDLVGRLPAGASSSTRARGPRQKRARPDQSVTASGTRLWRRAVIPVALAAALTAYLRHEGAKRVNPAAVAAAPPARPEAPAAAQPPVVVAPSPAAAPAVPTAEPPAPPPAPPAHETPPSSPPEALSAPEAKPAHEEEVAPAKPPQVERDPWQEPVPRALRPIRDRVDRGVHVSQRALVPVYEFARQNPGDPRPWLLLGHAYAELDWFSDAIDRYRHAYHVDSGARADPHMLADLRKAAGHPGAGRRAADAIREIYGAEAPADSSPGQK